MSNKKQFTAYFISSLVVIFAFLTQISSAQQITSTTESETRNPQTAQGKVIENQNSVQNSVDESLLNTTEKTITIEGGKPLPPPRTDAESSLGKVIALIGAGIFLALIMLVIFQNRSAKKQQKVVTQAKKPIIKEEFKKPQKEEKTGDKTAKSKKKKRRKSKKKR